MHLFTGTYSKPASAKSAISLDKEVEDKLRALSQRQKKVKRKKTPILLNVTQTKYSVGE